MKIAIAADDSGRPAGHFGEAPLYIVYTVEDGQVVAEERRAKPVCDHGANGHSHDSEEAEGPDLHTRMSDVIMDCQVVIARGIPAPMYRHLVGVGLEPLLAGAASAEEAVQEYLAGAS
jgi:predicted Fe-Mo cluster-binding NifX family protein